MDWQEQQWKQGDPSYYRVTDNKSWWQKESYAGGLDVGVKEELIPRFWT